LCVREAKYGILKKNLSEIKTLARIDSCEENNAHLEGNSWTVSP